MLFSSTIFLFVFLPLVTGVYYACPTSWRNRWLLAASLFFYAWGEPRYLAVMLVSILLNHAGALWLASIPISRRRGRHAALGLVCVLNLVLLVYFKYYNFLVENINAVWGGHLKPAEVWMPIGISFFTFQSISYVVDVYRQEVEAQRNLGKTALFISFFPQLIAGPILKYHDICRQIEARRETVSEVAAGLRRFITGLGKKVLLANPMGAVANPVFSMDTLDAPVAWLGAVAYALQLYFDFSGYSDMAIGLGRMFGFKIQENFMYPYISKSIAEFWRRWHISLGSWFREYLYFPLGGNRKGKGRTLFNLLIVFMATGIWHGANWTFLLWGLWHGLFIMLERLFGFSAPGGRLKNAALHLYVILVFGLGWVLFRADTLGQAGAYFAAMAGFQGEGTVLFSAGYFLTRKSMLVMAVAVLASTPLFQKMWDRTFGLPGRALARDAVLLAVLFLSILSIASGTYNPFIYFRF